MPARDLDRICEIAARLNEDAGLLRRLGLNDTADLLTAAEADLDSRVYANGSGDGSAAIVCELGAKPRRLRRAKGREARPH